MPALLPCASSGDAQDAILPFAGIRGAPNQHQLLDHRADRRILFHQEHARAVAARLEKLPEVAWHGLEIVRNENTLLLRCDSEHFWIRNTPEFRILS